MIDVSTGHTLIRPDDFPLVDVGDFNSYPSDVMKATEGIAGGVSEVVMRGGFSVCLGGDHYVGYPSCLGYTRALGRLRPNARVGYIHIDGHLDFADSYGPYGKYMNGTNARRISELDAMEPANMVFIGIQGPCYLDQVELIRRYGGTIFTSEDVEEMGPETVGYRAGELAMRGCDTIYMSFDIDVIDAGFSDGTGSVTMGAMTASTLFRILGPLSQFPIGSMDLVETSPPLDPSSRTPTLRRRGPDQAHLPQDFRGLLKTSVNRYETVKRFHLAQAPRSPGAVPGCQHRFLDSPRPAPRQRGSISFASLRHLHAGFLSHRPAYGPQILQADLEESVMRGHPIPL